MEREICEMEKYDGKKAQDSECYERNQMQKELIIQKLKDRGCRVTRQRLMLLDIILENDCSCCKEIYYRAADRDEKIGRATVYRMINTLEEIGAISRKNMYKVVHGGECGAEDACTVEFDDGTVARLSTKAWEQIVRTGLRECGYMQGKELRSVKVFNDKISQ